MNGCISTNLEVVPTDTPQLTLDIFAVHSAVICTQESLQ